MLDILTDHVGITVEGQPLQCPGTYKTTQFLPPDY